MLIKELRERYLEKENLQQLLEKNDINLINSFVDNWNHVLEFNRKYYAENTPRIVLCGINPGRKGAGKTGIPFLDFKSLSKLMPNIENDDQERSAQFFYEVVEYFGPENFYRTFYVTNYSWVGYTKKGKNFNYYNLPPEARNMVSGLFEYEMKQIKPTRIIPLSKKVQKNVQLMFKENIKTDISLPHPYYCSFKSRRERLFNKYIKTLEPFIKS